MTHVMVWGLSSGGYYAIRIAHTHKDQLIGSIAQGAGCHYFYDPEWLETVDGHEYPFQYVTPEEGSSYIAGATRRTLVLTKTKTQVDAGRGDEAWVQFRRRIQGGRAEKVLPPRDGHHPEAFDQTSADQCEPKPPFAR